MQQEQQHRELPIEMWQLIVAQCAAADQGNVGLVCKSWRRLPRPLGDITLKTPEPGEQTLAAQRWMLAHRHMQMCVTTTSGFVEQLLSTCTNVSKLAYQANGSVDVVTQQLPGLEHLVIILEDELSAGGGDLSKQVNLHSLEIQHQMINVTLTDLGLEHLPHLRRLVCVGVFLHDHFEMPRLTQLQHLELHCDTMEVIPEFPTPNLQHLLVQGSFCVLDALKHLVQLQHLGLCCDALDDLSGLSTLVRLQKLEMYVSPSVVFEDEDEEVVYMDITPLAALLQLRNLTLQCTLLCDISPLAKLVGLHVLDLSHSAVTGLAPVAGLTNLRVLDVSHSGVTSLAPLAELVNLGLEVVQRM